MRQVSEEFYYRDRKRKEREAGRSNVRGALRAAGLMVPEPSTSGPMPLMRSAVVDDEVAYMAEEKRKEK